MEAEKDLEDILLFCNKKGYLIKGKLIDTTKLVFEERIKMNCFYCGKYNMNWKCPPRLPQVDYQKMLSEFTCAAFVYLEKSLINKEYSTVRNDSSVQLHKALLECEKWLWEHNNATALSFIGGSCKLCKNGCAPERCSNPYMARIPVEALGINVVKSAAKVGIQINFPPKEHMIRIGLLLW